MKRLAGLVVIAIALGSALWWWLHSPRPASAPAMISPATEATATTTAPAYYLPLDQLNNPKTSVEDDLKILRELFFNYQIMVKDPSGNPRGTHEEIVRALQGHNRAHLVFVPSNHPALNKNGKLVDRWGTPYFFHALSGTSMEIRSAGPDREIFTDDDALLAPPTRERRL